ncbi:MAG: hypothetical protein JXR52_08890 [Bacteroidales bacterium]|nr:hypothetical protein [Bacteroidales bacterium]MBN2698929.1 hypothetical protein [Bacteroidales bacterium]
MKIIDAHMHISLNGMDKTTLIQHMDAHNIDKCWLLSWEELDPEINYLYVHLPLEDILDAHQSCPGRFIPFYAPDPADPAFREKLTASIKKGVRGCGELKVSRRWEDPLIETYLETIRKFEIPLVFHMENPRVHYIPDGSGFPDRVFERLLNDKFNGVSRYYLNRIIDFTGLFRKKVHANRFHFPGYLFDFEFLEKRIQQFSGISFIGHGPDFWNAISGLANPKFIHQTGKIEKFGIIDRLLETYDNLYCDISGFSGFNALSRDREASVIFLEKHYHKVLFGTDNTGLDLRGLLGSFRIPSIKMDRVLHGNAEKLMASPSASFK